MCINTIRRVSKRRERLKTIQSKRAHWARLTNPSIIAKLRTGKRDWRLSQIADAKTALRGLLLADIAYICEQHPQVCESATWGDSRTIQAADVRGLLQIWENLRGQERRLLRAI